jgi:hypothetical protein
VKWKQFAALKSTQAGIVDRDYVSTKIEHLLGPRDCDDALVGEPLPVAARLIPTQITAPPVQRQCLRQFGGATRV